VRELDDHVESVKQAALADRIVLTKADLADEASLAALEARLRQLNPAAPIVRSRNGEVEPAFILDIGFDAAGRDPGRIEGWLRAERYLPLPVNASHGRAAGAVHDSRIASFAITYDAPVSGSALWRALEDLIERHGENLLRVKGIVNVRGQQAPRVIHIVQHVLYPVLTLPQWPSADLRTRLVFIVRDLAQEVVVDTLHRALNAS
jgi:G3E family GTPase